MSRQTSSSCGIVEVEIPSEKKCPWTGTPFLCVGVIFCTSKDLVPLLKVECMVCREHFGSARGGARTQTLHMACSVLYLWSFVHQPSFRAPHFFCAHTKSRRQSRQQNVQINSVGMISLCVFTPNTDRWQLLAAESRQCTLLLCSTNDNVTITVYA